MTQEDTPRKGPSPKESSENLLAQSRRDFEQALERGESPRIEDCFGDVSGAERERLLQELLQKNVSALVELRPSAERDRLLQELLQLEFDHNAKTDESPSSTDSLATVSYTHLTLPTRDLV